MIVRLLPARMSKAVRYTASRHVGMANGLANDGVLELAIDNGLLTPWIMQEPYDIYHLRALPCYNQLLERARHHFHTTE